MLLQTFKIASGGKLIPDAIVEDEVAHRNDLLHQSVHAFGILEGSNHVCIRKRSSTEKRYPGFYTNTMGGHMGSTATALQTLEEISFKLAPATFTHPQLIYSFYVHDKDEHEICPLYVVSITPENRAAWEKHGRIFVPPAELERLVETNQVTPHLRAAWEIYGGNL